MRAPCMGGGSAFHKRFEAHGTRLCRYWHGVDELTDCYGLGVSCVWLYVVVEVDTTR